MPGPLTAMTGHSAHRLGTAELSLDRSAAVDQTWLLRLATLNVVADRKRSIAKGNQKVSKAPQFRLSSGVTGHSEI
jgi:hypothetical protein